MIIVLSVALIGVGHLVNRFQRKRLANLRQSKTLEEIFERNFSNVDREIFFETWQQLSSVLEMPPDKLSLDDTIRSLAKGRHLPETFFEQIETYLADNGLEPNETSIDLTVKELIQKLVKVRS